MDKIALAYSGHELERMDQICVHCGAKFWIEEKIVIVAKHLHLFAVCCAGGKVSLPLLLHFLQLD
jgi:hypothetical protein